MTFFAASGATMYCARGEMENRIKECQLGLFSDRTSCHLWWPISLFAVRGTCLRAAGAPAHHRPGRHRARTRASLDLALSSAQGRRGHRFVERSRLVAQIGDHEARIRALGIVFGFGDHPAVARPVAGAVVEFAEDGWAAGSRRKPVRLARATTRRPPAAGCSCPCRRTARGRARTRKTAAEAEAGVATEDDAHARPRLAQPSDQQFQIAAACSAASFFAGRRGDQQLLATEHVQRQETVVVVIGAEVTSFLIAMDQIVGGIEVEHQFFRVAGTNQ